MLLCVVFFFFFFFFFFFVFFFFSTRWFVFVLAFFSSFYIAITWLAEERANLSAFHTFVRLALTWFCLSSRCLGRAVAYNCGTLWTFLLPLFIIKEVFIVCKDSLSIVNLSLRIILT